MYRERCICMRVHLYIYISIYVSLSLSIIYIYICIHVYMYSWSPGIGYFVVFGTAFGRDVYQRTLRMVVFFSGGGSRPRLHGLLHRFKQ